MIKLKNILAESMTRFNTRKLNEVATSTPVTINYQQSFNFEPGKLPSAAMVQSLFDGVLAELKKNAETSKMLSSKSIAISSAVFIGGASNKWGSLGTTAFNVDASSKPVTPTDQQGSMPGFDKNKTLAEARAKSCQDQLFALLRTLGVIIRPSIEPKTFANVYDTGGKLDTSKQLLKVTLRFNYMSPSDITTVNQINPSFIMQGSYNAKGLSGSKTSNLSQSDPKTYNLSTGLLSSAMKNDPNRLSAFEVKWNPDVLANGWKTPWYRWIFIYNAAGKIVRIEGRGYDTTLNASLKNFFKDGAVALNDPTMIYMMNLNDPTNFARRVQPYL